MSLAWQLDCLFARMKSLRTEIRRVTEKQPDHSIIRAVYASLIETVRQYERLLQSAKDRVDPARPRSVEQLEDRYAVVAEQVEKLTHLFRSCDRVDSPRIPFEILRSLSAVASILTGRDTRIVVHLSTDYNYQITSLRRVFERSRWDRWWAPTDATAETDILLMVFPSYEVSTTLLHAAAAHELAHVLAHMWWDDISRATSPVATRIFEQYRQQRSDFVDSATTLHPESADEASESAWRVIQYRDYLLSTGWVVETFADLIAARLVGPAYLGALDRISVGSRDDISHPPLAVRRTVIHRYLKSTLPHVAGDLTWREILRADATASHIDLFTEAGTEICLNIIEPLRPILDRVASPLADIELLARSVTEAGVRIDNLAPPSLDVAVPDDGALVAEFWRAIYATWHYRMTDGKFDELCRRYGWRGDASSADAALNSLLLHALQDLEVKQRLTRELGS